VVAGGTNQIACVLNQQKLDLFRVPIGQPALDHVRFQVHASPVVICLTEKTEAGQAPGTIVSPDFRRAGQHGHTPIL